MTFKFNISPELRKRLDKLARKDRNLAIAVRQKIQQIISCDKTAIDHYKNLRGAMSSFKRVHVGSFVLLFKVEGDTIVFDRFVHHDDAYN